MKWTLDVIGLEEKLREFGIKRDTKFMLSGHISVGMFGGTLILKETESQEEIKVPYRMDNHDTLDLSGLNIMQAQIQALKELAQETKDFISDNYNIIIVDFVNQDN